MRALARVLASPWTTKTLAGLLLGYALALAVVALFVALVPAPATQTFQMAMWLVVPVWLTVLSFVYLFPTAVGAWAWLGGGTALAWALVAAARAALS